MPATISIERVAGWRHEQSPERGIAVDAVALGTPDSAGQSLIVQH